MSCLGLYKNIYNIRSVYRQQNLFNLFIFLLKHKKKGEQQKQNLRKVSLFFFFFTNEFFTNESVCLSGNGCNS